MKYIYNKEKNSFFSEYGEEIIFTNIKFINQAIKPKDKENDVESEVLGLWTCDLINQSDVYYTIINELVTEFVAYKVYGKSKYIINMDWQIIECIPENGDIIYSEYKEAKSDILYLLSHKIESFINYEM